MTPKLNDEEQKAWNEGGWTPEGAAAVDVLVLAKELKVPIGRAATIKASCSASSPGKTVVQRALEGDAGARRDIAGRTRGLPWVALRNGKPDESESELLVAELEKNGVLRTLFHGLIVVSIESLATAATKIPRSPITGAALDDHAGKLVDGESGADWGPCWPERGNGRALWVAHAPKHMLPSYAAADSARAAAELANADVPIQWKRIEQAWQAATPTERAAAEERLFAAARPPVAEASLQHATWAAMASGHGCPGFRGSCKRAGEVGRCGRVVLAVGRGTASLTLRERLIDKHDSDFGAFVLDYFPDVYARFSAGMDKTQKVTLLLSLRDPAEIAAALAAA